MLSGSVGPYFPRTLFGARLQVLVFQTESPRTGQGAKSVKTLSRGRTEVKVGQPERGGERVGQRHGENAHQ